MDPFTVTAIDFTGALYVRAFEGKNKVYTCLSTYASTQAIHLEVVNDFSEETFMQAFRRFWVESLYQELYCQIMLRHYVGSRCT